MTNCLTTIQSYGGNEKVTYDPSSKLQLLHHPHSDVIAFQALDNQLIFTTGCIVPWLCDRVL